MGEREIVRISKKYLKVLFQFGGAIALAYFILQIFGLSTEGLINTIFKLMIIEVILLALGYGIFEYGSHLFKVFKDRVNKIKKSLNEIKKIRKEINKLKKDSIKTKDLVKRMEKGSKKIKQIEEKLAKIEEELGEDRPFWGIGRIFTPLLIGKRTIKERLNRIENKLKES